MFLNQAKEREVIEIDVTIQIKQGTGSEQDHITALVGEVVMFSEWKERLTPWQRTLVAAALTANAEDCSRISGKYGSPS